MPPYRLAAPVALITAALCGAAADWPQWRGPGGAGVCPGCGPLPAIFGPETNVIWKTALPEGKSSPVLAGDSIFLTGAEDGGRLVTLRLNRRTGAIDWRRTVQAARREAQHRLNHRAAPTPATDGKRLVFVFFADFGLLAYDFDGNLAWQLPLGPFNSQHGVAASPVYAEGMVILVCDQDTDAFILGVEADSGKVTWKRPRHVINGYSTPVIYRPPDSREPTQVIAAGSYHLTSYAVANGRELWTVRGLTCQPKSAPVIAGDVLYFNGWTPGNDAGEQVELPPFAAVVAQADHDRDGRLAPNELPKPWQPTGAWRAVDLDRDGYLNEREWAFFRTRRASRNGLLAVKLDGGRRRGDVTDVAVLWRYEKSLPDVPAPLVWNGVVLLVRNGGIATTLDAATGKLLRQGRLSGALDDYYASPVLMGDRVAIASEHGRVVVFRFGPGPGDWEVEAVQDFSPEPVYATPALAERRLYLRTLRTLYAIGRR